MIRTIQPMRNATAPIRHNESCLQKRTNSKGGDVTAWIAPCLSSHCYRVSTRRTGVGQTEQDQDTQKDISHDL